MSDANVPVPRMEFQWRREPQDEMEENRKEDLSSFGETVFCDYGLVLPLDYYDIRAEGEDGELGVRKEVFYKFSTTVSSGVHNEDYPSTPFRDGVHAIRDGRLLGSLPVWVKTLSGKHIEAPGYAEKMQQDHKDTPI